MSSKPPAIHADFVRDATELLRAALAQEGYATDPTATGDKIWFPYFNVAKRLIEPKPRRVLEVASLACPPAHARGFAALKAKIERGDDLRPHLSKGLLKADYNDMLLNDWGIYHLHFGETPDPKDPSFNARTKEVLFAFFRPDAAYLVGIHPHGRGVPEPWAKLELAELIYRTWPAVMAPYEVKGVKPGPDPVVDEQDRLEVRKCGVLTPLVIDGKSFFGPGAGYSTSGLGADVLNAADFHRKSLRKIQERMIQMLPDNAAKAGVQLPDPAILKLVAHDGNLMVEIEGVEPLFELFKVPWPLLSR